MSLFKTIVGGGILSLPAGMAAGTGTGIVPALGILSLHGLMSAYTYSLVGRAVKKTGATNFAEIWGAAFGSETSWVIDVMIMAIAGGACLAYGCFLGDLLIALSGGAVGRTAAILGLAVFPLAPLALETAAWGALDPASDLPWLDPPPAGRLDAARDLLVRLGALERGKPHRVTEMGRLMLRLPLHPRLARMVLWGAARGPESARLACQLAAVLGDRDILRGRDAPVDVRARLGAAHSRQSLRGRTAPAPAPRMGRAFSRWLRFGTDTLRHLRSAHA